MEDSKCSVSVEEEVIIDGEQNGLTNGSICVNPRTCIIYFKPGHTYTDKIKLLNMTVLPQIIWIQPPDSKIFKFPNLDTMSIPPGESWNLQFTFMSNSDQEFKSYLHLKNPTGQGNLAIELKAVPKAHSSLPRTINFGNVDIGMSVTRKLHLAPESNPYQFRIFIPHESHDLNVNPTVGKVSCKSSMDITLRYTPKSYMTLRTDLVFYHSEANQKPQVITVIAVTKPKDNVIQNKKTMKSVPTTIGLSVRQTMTNRRNVKTEKNNLVFSRLNLNKKTLTNKPNTIPTNYYSWNNALGEPDEVYRNAYAQGCKDFLLNAKLFGDKYKNVTSTNIRREPNTTTIDKNLKRDIIKKREVEWENYKEKLCSYQNVLYDDGLQVSRGLRERSIRMNNVKTSVHDFDPNLDDNWWVRFQTYNKFVNAVREIIIKNRLKKRLNIFKLLISNNIIN